MKLFLSILTFLSLSLLSHSQSTIRWHISKSNGEQGFIDSSGREVFTGKFDFLRDTYDDGLALYQKGSEVGFLDVNGKVVFNLPIPSGIYGIFSEGLCCVNEPDQFYYLNTKGELAVDLKNLKLPEGKELSWCYNFHNGLALVRIQNIRNKEYDPGPPDVVDMNNLYRGDWFYGYINRACEWVIEPDLDEAYFAFEEGITTVEKNGKLYLLDTIGNTVATFDSTNIGVFWNGFGIVNRDSFSYFIDKHGKRLGKVNFTNVHPFYDGMAAVEIDDKWGFINTEGEIVIEPKYCLVNNFNEGVASGSIRMEEYFIRGFFDKKGNTIIPFEKHVVYDYRGFRNGIVQGRRVIYNVESKYTGYYELFYINRKGVKIWSDILKQ